MGGGRRAGVGLRLGFGLGKLCLGLDVGGRAVGGGSECCFLDRQCVELCLGQRLGLGLGLGLGDGVGHVRLGKRLGVRVGLRLGIDGGLTNDFATSGG